MMLSTPKAAFLAKLLALLLIAALSACYLSSALPDSSFIQNSAESVEENKSTVLKFSAATLSASLAISALPDDFATPLAESLSDMNIYFVAILTLLFLEEVLLQYGIPMVFTYLIPVACALGVIAFLTKKALLKNLAVRLSILGLAVALVVPVSTHLTNAVSENFTAYVNDTISATEGGANKINEAMYDGAEDKTVFEKLSTLFETAIRSVSDLMQHLQNTVSKCMNSIAILILTNCLMPLLTFRVLLWVLKETFHIAIPLPPMKLRREAPAAELIAAGGGNDET